MDDTGPRFCGMCGEALAPDQRFCAHCGSERPTQHDSAAQGLSQGDMAGVPDALVWEIDVGILTNPLVLAQLTLVVGLSGFIMALLLSFLMAVQGEWERILTVLLISLIGAGAVGLLMLFVILVFFRNRFRVRCTVSEEGILVETTDARAKAGNRLAVLLGLFGGSASTTGAGLVGMSRESEFSSWGGIAGARFYPRAHSIALRNRWRAVAFLPCTRDNYEPVAALVRQKIAAREVGPAATRGSPLPRLIGRSLLVVLATLPVFLLPYPFELDLFAPLLMLCFALATVWLVHLFGWVVIAAALWIAAEIVLIGLEVKQSIFLSVGTYRNFEILNTGDWIALTLAAAGLAYLVVYSWLAARGRLPSALGDDYAEMED